MAQQRTKEADERERTCTELLIPLPTLEFDFRIIVDLDPQSPNFNPVHKEAIAVLSGQWSGTFGNGHVLAGGYDLGQARGSQPIRIMECAFVLQNSEQNPAKFEVRTRGALSGPCHVLDQIIDPRKKKEFAPQEYSFRMFCTVKATDHRYVELVNTGLWVASGAWKDRNLIIDAFRVM
ncbi:hypothetical protein NQ176_g2357 [Zarea fungicola]|uniref:Uncharacterized protein n=1 Tax=Zarea fungicola TaxID=93591 RepID=A0ACC1NR69_9HYPO|nr:hypothetical protein NQ176_g2357 [Lecanicillium fungicola]